MRTALLALGVFLGVAGVVPCQDAAPTEAVVAAVKRATVFVQVQGMDWKGSGSGFVVRTNKDTVLIATNYHVLAGPHAERKTRPGEATRLAKAANVKLVFDSGTKDERTVKAEAVAVDSDADLAVLRAVGLTDPPTPINSATPPKLYELMPVYSFGYPFGKALGVGQSGPAVTVGKASISSLRLSSDGELSSVQIDGNLNPGNSGGPLVDTKGQLVGVAVAKIRDGQGIGFAIPAAELNRVVAGGLGRPFLTIVPGKAGTITVKAEVGVIDPEGAIREVTLHYVVADAKARKPGRFDLLQKFAGVKHVVLKVDGGVASGEFSLDKPAGELFVQAVPDARDGKGLTLVRSLDLSGAAVLAGGKPPTGWKEFVAKDNGFSVWIPEGARRQSEQERTAVVRGLRLRSTSLRVEMAGGLIYTVDQLILPGELANKLKHEELEDGFRDWVASELDGKVTEETDVQLGAVAGREYRIEAGGRAGRVRLFVSGGRVLVLEVTGTHTTLDDVGVLTFMNSCHLSPTAVRKNPPVVSVPSTAPRTAVSVGVPNNVEEKRKLPPASERERVSKLARDLFQEEFANSDPAAKADFAAKLFRQAVETNDDAAAQFVLYRESAELAAAGDIELALRACEALMARFEGSSADLLEPVLEIVATKATKPEASSAVAIFAMRYVDQALATDAIETAARLHKLAEKSARLGKDLKILTNVQTRADEIEVARKNNERFGVAATTLMRTPNDADACLVFGKHVCFWRGDWKQGLPFLAKSSDVKLKEIAVKELETSEGDRAAAVALADAWYEMLDSIKDYPKTRVQMRIHGLYSKALSSATGLTKAKIEKRLDELDTLLQGKLENAALWQTVRTAVRDRTYQKIDLMGGAFGDKDYSEILEEGGILIGFNYTYKRFGNQDSIDSFQPIYLTPSGEKLGAAHGVLDSTKLMTLKAKPNYAIGKMAIRGGGLWGGTNVIFMRMDGKTLKPSDSYESGWIGHKDQPNSPFLGDGRPIIGIHGKNQRNEVGICSIGLFVIGEKPAEPKR